MRTVTVLFVPSKLTAITTELRESGTCFFVRGAVRVELYLYHLLGLRGLFWGERTLAFYLYKHLHASVGFKMYNII